MKAAFAVLIITASAAFFSSCGEKKAGTHQTKVIAHRGYWNTEGSAQNSLASLRKAAEIGCYGSEFDVHLTEDGVAIVTHDDDIDGLIICENPYSAFEGYLLKNGETLPTLRQYLEEGLKHPNLRLILEIKSATTPEHETRSVGVIMDMVGELGLHEQVEYIAFSYHICKEIVSRDASAAVAYLEGDKTPQELKADGMSGLDYYIGIIRSNPSILSEARKLGISTNSWTVNAEDDMRLIIDQGIDFITTDYPELALLLTGESIQF